MEKQQEQGAPLARPPLYGWSRVSMPQPVPSARSASGAAAGGTSAAGNRPAMEGTVLYQKVIDNSTVHYRYDPRDREVLRRSVSWGLFIVLLVLMASGPRVWVRHSGYRQAELNQRIDDLVTQRDQLKVRKGRMEELQRVAMLAEQSGLQETDEARFRWHTAPSNEGDGEVARLF